MRTSLVSGLTLLLLVLACGKETSPPPNQPEPKPPATTPAALHLGEPISAPTVTLADVAAHAADYKGKTFATNGVVTAVCQQMGCWMEITDANSAAHIRMHGHSFFVPKTASGHHARVQASLVPASGNEEDCTEEAAKQMGHPAAKVELDATGVELLD